jgi:hypothetical protein
MEAPPPCPAERNTGKEEPLLPPLLEAPVPYYFREILVRLFGERRWRRWDYN